MSATPSLATCPGCRAGPNESHPQTCPVRVEVERRLGDVQRIRSGFLTDEWNNAVDACIGRVQGVCQDKDVYLSVWQALIDALRGLKR